MTKAPQRESGRRRHLPAGPGPAPSERRLVRALVAFAQPLAEQWTAELKQSGTSALAAGRESLAELLARDISDVEAADVLAQSVACALPILAAMRDRERPIAWLLQQAAPWECLAIQTAEGYIKNGSPPLRLSPSPSLLATAHLYETFLHHYSHAQRKSRGVYFTPRPIANFIIRQADLALRDQFALPDGLAACCQSSSSPAALPTIVDPAAGTGVFLLAVINRILETLTQKWQREGLDQDECRRRWNLSVPQLLDHLIGVEILPAAALLLKLNITARLAETGYRFEHVALPNIRCADALDPAIQAQIQNPQSQTAGRFPVILGNPPFSSLSASTNPWIARLVRGDHELRGYVRANGQKLGERKTWLHDDYVKFLRLAQWHVEQAGCGLVGLVTNRGYLDNATFRLLRHELLRVFPHVRLVDLHGSRKAGDVAPGGGRDENVFGLDQGVAIGLFCRPGEGSVVTRDDVRSPVEYFELWGDRQSKLGSLADGSLLRGGTTFTPAPPNWRLVPPRKVAIVPEYDAGWPLTAAMPLHASAPVTARDRFVVAFTREELCERITTFRDLSIPVDEIRRRYFTRTRSSRYPPGDSRGWKLSAARRLVAADDSWQEHIVRCLYRPFDWRWIYWHPAMIDWPRTEVTRHLMKFDFVFHKSETSDTRTHPESCILNSPFPSLCLIARRQQLASQPCSFFWISDGLALDGVIRSDNRGSESLFPLYLHDGDGGSRNVRANFAPQFVAAVRAATGLAWQPLGPGGLQTAFGPEELLAYIYALFHAPSYRERYAEQLRHDFPRVIVPQSPALLRKWSRLGGELIQLHLLRMGPADPGVEPKHVKNEGPSRLHPPPELPADVMSFRVGGYVALRKWLQPPHRSPDDPHYHRMAAAIGRTIEIMAEIDARQA